MSLLLEVLRKHEAERRGETTPPGASAPPPAPAPAPADDIHTEQASQTPAADARSPVMCPSPLSLEPLNAPPTGNSQPPAPPPFTTAPQPIHPPPPGMAPTTPATTPHSHARWAWIAGLTVAGLAGLAGWVWSETRPTGLSPIQLAQARGAEASTEVQPPVSAPPPETPPETLPAAPPAVARSRTTSPAARPPSPARTDPPDPPDSDAHAALRFEPRPMPVASPQPDLLRAHDAYTRGDLTAAHQHYQAALSLDPTNPDAHDGLGALALHSGLHVEAARHFRLALAARPTDSAALAGLASLPGNDSRQAESRLRSSLDADAGDATAQFALGTVLARQQRWAEAQHAFFRARSLAPEDPDIAYNLAVSLDHLRQPGPAAAHYRLALQLAERHLAEFDRAACAARIDALAAPDNAP